MGDFIAPEYPLARGVVLHCLAEASNAPNARELLETLRDDIVALAPTYQGLESVFDRCLVANTFDERVRANIQQHLRRHWFDPASPDTFFPDVDVAPIYAAGVLKTIELALSGPEVASIDGWWLVDVAAVKVINVAHLDDGRARGQVTLLILTPRPEIAGPVSRNPILGRSAQAWVTEAGADAVATRRLRDD